MKKHDPKDCASFGKLKLNKLATYQPFRLVEIVQELQARLIASQVLQDELNKALEKTLEREEENKTIRLLDAEDSFFRGFAAALDRAAKWPPKNKTFFQRFDKNMDVFALGWFGGGLLVSLVNYFL